MTPILYALAALLGLLALITVDLAILHQSQAIAAWGWLVAKLLADWYKDHIPGLIEEGGE